MVQIFISKMDKQNVFFCYFTYFALHSQNTSLLDRFHIDDDGWLIRLQQYFKDYLKYDKNCVIY